MDMNRIKSINHSSFLGGDREGMFVWEEQSAKTVMFAFVGCFFQKSCRILLCLSGQNHPEGFYP